jgi:hypothetical protein
MAEAKQKNVTIQRDALREKPIELIKIDGDRLEANQEAIKFLNNLNEEIVVVSIIGKDGVDKSFLQSLLIENPNNNGVKFI